MKCTACNKAAHTLPDIVRFANLPITQVQHGPLDETFVAYILHEVLVALAYLHSENRIHRDIKAANILLGPAGAHRACTWCMCCVHVCDHLCARARA